MTVLIPSRLCLVAMLVHKANAFTVAPPVAIEVPVYEGFVSVSSVQSSSSNLPSQRQLLDSVGSFTLAATAPTKTAKEPASANPQKSTSVAKDSGVGIDDIFFDGKVPKTESDEYVVIKNSSKSAVDVSGYAIYPATSGNQGSTFTFPKGSTIKPNESVRIYTNEIHKETGGYSWGSGKALWSNKGGVAVLQDNNGKKLGEYKYVPPS